MVEKVREPLSELVTRVQTKTLSSLIKNIKHVNHVLIARTSSHLFAVGLSLKNKFAFLFL